MYQTANILNIVTANPTLGTCTYLWVGVDRIQGKALA